MHINQVIVYTDVTHREQTHELSGNTEFCQLMALFLECATLFFFLLHIYISFLFYPQISQMHTSNMWKMFVCVFHWPFAVVGVINNARTIPIRRHWFELKNAMKLSVLCINLIRFISYVYGISLLGTHLHWALFNYFETMISYSIVKWIDLFELESNRINI